MLTIATRTGSLYTLSYGTNGVTTVTDSTGRALVLTSNEYGIVTSMTVPGGGVYLYEYGENGALNKVVFPGGAFRKYLYEDNRHKFALTGIEDERGVRVATYAYDASGFAISTERALYDNKYTVARVDYGTVTNASATDAFGTTHNYSFKNIGGVNRLDSHTIPGTTYLVNGLGQRVKKSTAAADTFFAYDEAGRLLGEYDGAGAPIQETVWLGNTPVAIVKPKQPSGYDIFYVWADHLNTPRIVSDAANTIRWEWRHADAFGANAPDENPAGAGVFAYNLRFPGQYFDQETGLHYNYFRDYDPRIGRYVQSDPIGLDGGLNTYGYVEQDPLLRSDPLGLFGPLGAAAGGAISAGVQFAVCQKLGGSFQTCMKCINLADVAISMAMGAVAPTWLGNVGKGIFNLNKTRSALTAAGGPAMGRMAGVAVAGDATKAAMATGFGFIGKINVPSIQFGCEDECSKYRLSPEAMASLTSFF